MTVVLFEWACHYHHSITPSCTLSHFCSITPVLLTHSLSGPTVHLTLQGVHRLWLPQSWDVHRQRTILHLSQFGELAWKCILWSWWLHALAHCCLPHTQLLLSSFMLACLFACTTPCFGLVAIGTPSVLVSSCDFHVRALVWDICVGVCIRVSVSTSVLYTVWTCMWMGRASVWHSAAMCKIFVYCMYVHTYLRTSSSFTLLSALLSLPFSLLPPLFTLHTPPSSLLSSPSTPLPPPSSLHPPHPSLLCPPYTLLSQAFKTMWYSSKHNMGFGMNRATWNKVKACTREFCTFDDYNWDWSLCFLSKRCLEPPLQVLVSGAPRVFHIGTWWDLAHVW